MKREEWALVPFTETVPNKENTIDCVAFICMFGYFISQDAFLEFSQADVTNFRKRMALAIINYANNTEVQADSVEDSSSSSNDRQETNQLGVMFLRASLITKYFHQQMMVFMLPNCTTNYLKK